MVIDEQNLKQIKREAQKKSISSTENWKDFLKTASNVHKYDFSQQILIYAQNPNVRACATKEIWEKLKYEVPENTRAIAILKDNENKQDNFEYIFDIRDTEALPNAKEPYIWQMKDNYEEDIINKLSLTYDIDLNNNDLEYSISNLVQNMTDEYCSQLGVLSNLHGDIQNSILEDYDDLNLNLTFKNVINASVEHMVLERLNYNINNTNDYIDNRLDDIVMFNTPKILSNLGVAVNTISNELLNEIGSIVKLKDQELQKEEMQNGYNRANVPQRGEIFNSEYSNREQYSSRNDRQVWENEEKVLEKSSTSTISTTTAGGRTLGASSGSGHIGGGNDGEDSQTNETSSRSDGGTQSQRPNEVGSDDKQYPPTSPRDSDGRDNIYLDSSPEDDIFEITEIIAEELVFQELEDGIDVYNTLDESKVASISLDGNLNIYTKFLSEEALEKLELVADSMVQPLEITAEELVFQELEDGIDVYNTLDESKVANISFSGDLNIYNKDLSQEAINKLELVSDSMVEPSEIIEEELVDDNIIQLDEIIAEELVFQELEDGIDVYNTLDESKVANISFSGDLNIYTEFLSEEALEKLELVSDSMVEPLEIIEEELVEDNIIQLDEIIAEELVFQELEDGIDVYNTLDESKVANISLSGDLNIYTEFLSEEALEKLELIADSIVQSEEIISEEPIFEEVEAIEIKENSLPIYFFEDFNEVRANIDLKAYPEEAIVGFDKHGTCYKISMNDDRGLIINSETALGGGGYPRLSTLAIENTNIENLQESFINYLIDLDNPDTITPELVEFGGNNSVEKIEEVIIQEESLTDILADDSKEVSKKNIEETPEELLDSTAQLIKNNLDKDINNSNDISITLYENTQKTEFICLINNSDDNTIITDYLEKNRTYHEVIEVTIDNNIIINNELVTNKTLDRITNLGDISNRFLEAIEQAENFNKKSKSKEELNIFAGNKSEEVFISFGRSKNKSSILNFLDVQANLKHIGINSDNYNQIVNISSKNNLKIYDNDNIIKILDKLNIVADKISTAKPIVPELSQEEVEEPIEPPKVEPIEEEVIEPKVEANIDDIKTQEESLTDISDDRGVEVPKEDIEEIEFIVPEYDKVDDGLIETDEINEINQEKSNFKIDNFELGYGTPREKFNKNVLAIETLNKIDIENITATPEEQKILHEYVGWGGIPEAFDTSKENWKNEQGILKNLLSKEDYESASASVLNAHYTPPIVIEAIFNTLEKMNLPEDVSIIDPALGVGNFFGMIPESLENANLFGVELDNISGKIAKKLYPDANIKISGFEKVNLKDNTFDIAVGNVPFGDVKLNDIENKHNKFVIHDFFFAKALDKVKKGGIVAFVTSKGTLDKVTPTTREYLAKNADLLGAIRLPNDTFKKNANTSVTSDVIFLQKREEPPEVMPSWVDIGENSEGLKLNNYFIENPDMILGKLEEVSTQFGMDLACVPHEDANFKDLLEVATEKIIKPNYKEIRENIEAEVEVKDIINIFDDTYDDIKNFSFTIIDDNLYFKEDSKLNLFTGTDKQENLIKDLVEIRDTTRELIDIQVNNCSDDKLNLQQDKLNNLYDDFTKNHNIINSKTVKKAFSDDVSYPLLCSLEVLDDENKVKGKADIFSKRTIKQVEKVENVDTPLDALTVSVSEKGKVDLEFMADLLNIDKPQEDKIDFIIDELNSKGLIFKDPDRSKHEDKLNGWFTEDEYLSGNVVDKLEFAKYHAEKNEKFKINVECLEKVQPVPLLATEIDVRLGATWIDAKYYTEFMQELLNTPRYLDDEVVVQFSEPTSVFSIANKSKHSGVLVNETYGTDYKSAYSILEDTLNLKDILIKRTEKNTEGKEVEVLDAEKTRIVQAKQEEIGQKFKDWIFATPERREDLAQEYNYLFNNSRARTFNGENIKFEGMNAEISLNPHQKDAVARTLFGGNTLLAHCVGAGKTYTMIASAMEGKRLGLHNKALFVVPNHLTEQIGSDIYKLYPNANVLVATKNDFTPENRKKFCSKIATGNFDAIVIGHTQFEKIPLSIRTQEQIFEKQIDDIIKAISDAKHEKDPSSRFTIKQLQKTYKNLSLRFEKLQALEKKDDVVTFEQLGVDKLYVDEAHSFKNLFLHTKMRNVSGLGQSEAQKSTDMFAKCQYMDELTGNKGIVFATGTPLSNSMTELYTLMRYLQYDTLEKTNLKNFDAWASTFGERVTKLDIAPEGTGFRMKTSFSKFFNLDELINLWKDATDVKTADMLKLDVPSCEHITVVTKPSEFQKQILETFVERADSVRSRSVLPDQDNMLKITNDGRKMALDQRLIDDLLPDNPESKLNKCNENVFKIWEDTKDIKGTQLIFCDLSTPKPDKFNVYDDIKNKLVEKGIPPNEIAFIHDAKTEVQKDKLFKQVRKGDIRVIIGSTEKMGAGTNIQDRLVALHHTDCP